MICGLVFSGWRAAISQAMSIAVSGLLKQRLIAGAVRLDGDSVRHEGAGGMLARVIETEAIESLAIGGGLAVMLILQTLRWGPQHGYGIAAAIRAGSQEVLQVETGSLYPALHRMEKQGWVKSEWKQTDNNQRAKFYNLTAAGRKHLAAEQSRWHQMTGAIAGLMNRGEA